MRLSKRVRMQPPALERPRREFLKRLALWLSSGLGLAVAAGCDRSDTHSEPASGTKLPASLPAAPKLSPLANALRGHFDYLKVDVSVLESFVRDYESAYGPWKPGRQPKPFTRFLASTDFFQNGGDESHALGYVTLYDPYESPCYNPFSS